MATAPRATKVPKDKVTQIGPPSLRSMVIGSASLLRSSREGEGRKTLTGPTGRLLRTGEQPEAGTINSPSTGVLTNPFLKLTELEIKISLFVEQGMIDRDIATEIDSTKHVVKKHNRNIFSKLGIDNRVQLGSLVRRYIKMVSGKRKKINDKTSPDQPGFKPSFNNIFLISLVRDGENNHWIGEQMEVSERTVKGYMNRLFGDLGINDGSYKRGALVSLVESSPRYKKIVGDFDRFLKSLGEIRSAIRFTEIRETLKGIGVDVDPKKTKKITKILRSYTKFRIILRTINQETREKILEAHRMGMSMRKGAGHAGVTAKTIGKYWRIKGLKAHNKFGSSNQKRISDEQRSKALEAHRLEMSVEKAAKYANIGMGTLLGIWKQADLSAHGEYVPAITEKQKAKLRDAHALEISLRQAAKHAKVSLKTACNFWKSEGLKAHNEAPQLALKARGIG